MISSGTGFHLFSGARAVDSGGTPITYGVSGPSINVILIEGGSSDPVLGWVDGGHGAVEFTFEGRLRFTPSSSASGFVRCDTSLFSFTVDENLGWVPGSHTLTEANPIGTEVIPTVAINGVVCDSTAASTINSTFGLGNNQKAVFQVLKIRFTPTIAGSNP